VRIAIIAPPFIPVPPIGYGGTELFLADLAEGLVERGHDVIVYANGASQVACDVRGIYTDAEWPLQSPSQGALKSVVHGSWAFHDAAKSDVDLIHVNDSIHVPLSRFVSIPVVHTLHHPHEPELTSLYQLFPHVSYVAISRAQCRLEPLPHISTIHHGLRLSNYTYRDSKQDYVCFLGRIAPVKAPHLAIEAAQRAGVRLKIAGEIQPIFRSYFDEQIAPHLDGWQVEYVGEADLAAKNDLLSNARALLFPIQWEEPFGLVMAEANACGTPVLAFQAGSVPEVIEDGVNGRICEDVEEMAEWARDPCVDAFTCRRRAEQHFSIDVMVDAYEALYRGVLRTGRRQHVESV
jgi:glycosyltransferase involved in cell wall biosynthesis